MKRIWHPIHKTPRAGTAVELRFDDGSSDLVIWTGSRWLPDTPHRSPKAWRHLPVRLGSEKARPRRLKGEDVAA